MFLPKILKLHYLPTATCVWIMATFIVTYFMSTSSGHVYPYFPFISDTGSLPPESCIFAEMLNIGALFMFGIVYVRHRQVYLTLSTENIVLNKRWNPVATILGILACLGITVVANFQETALLVVHLFGAVMTFGNGCLYLILQTRITYAFIQSFKQKPNKRLGPNTLYLRLIATIFFTLLYCTVAICTVVALLQFTGTTIIWWTVHHGGYDVHLAATIAEWILVAVFFIYIISFTNEFKSLEYEEIRFKRKCVKAEIAENKEKTMENDITIL